MSLITYSITQKQEGDYMKINVLITRQENADYFHVMKGATVTVDFEEYVAAVVASEVGNSSIETCKAQAVAARTLAVSRGVLKGTPISDSSSTDQAYRVLRYNKKVYPNAIEGANQTAGQILCYKGKPISSVYSACNGGRTVSSEEKWGSIRPYLTARDDPWDVASGRTKRGHGVGMSQAGAWWAGAHGATYEDILAFYYPCAELYINYGETSILITHTDEIKINAQQLIKLKEQLKTIQEQLQEFLNG